jgi:hypothetical protein
MHFNGPIRGIYTSYWSLSIGPDTYTPNVEKASHIGPTGGYRIQRITLVISKSTYLAAYGLLVVIDPTISIPMVVIERHSPTIMYSQIAPILVKNNRMVVM